MDLALGIQKSMVSVVTEIYSKWASRRILVLFTRTEL